MGTASLPDQRGNPWNGRFIDPATPAGSFLPAVLPATAMLETFCVDLVGGVLTERVAAEFTTTPSRLTTGAVLALLAAVIPGENGYSVIWNWGERNLTRTSPKLPSPYKV